MKPRMKNVLKNLVKENQRIHDYTSPFGVKFWNYILKYSKSYDKRRHKVREENLPQTLDVYYNWKKKRYNEVETELEKEIIAKQISQIEYFLENWKDMILEGTGRLKPEHRIILNENLDEKFLKARLNP